MLEKQRDTSVCRTHQLLGSRFHLRALGLLHCCSWGSLDSITDRRFPVTPGPMSAPVKPSVAVSPSSL
jgi:hypothetical protein